MKSVMGRRAPRIVGLVFALFLPNLAAAGFASIRPSPRKVAVLVGANHGARGRAPLRYSYEDARSMAAVLYEVGGFQRGDVEILLDPKPRAILAALDKNSRKVKYSDSGSMLLFYYSGHSDSRALYSDGKPLELSEVRARLDRSAAMVRVGIIDACRGGGWTGTKGMEPSTPFDVIVPEDLTSEGSVLIASSSGQESAHESVTIRGSFFTHHFIAALRGAGDQSGDGEVTVGEAFAYAKGLTIRDSILQAEAPQHPSFDMNLRGRTDIALSRIDAGQTQVELRQTTGPLQVIQLSTGIIVVDVPSGKRTLSVALPAGRYLVRRQGGSKTYAREISVEIDRKTEVSEESLVLVGTASLANKYADDLPLNSETTVRAGHLEIELNLDAGQLLTRASGVAPTSSSALNYLSVRAVWGLTDRLQWLVPFPAMAYRFGSRGGLEIVSSLSAEPDFSDTRSGYLVYSQNSTRWWITDLAALNFSLQPSYFGSFQGGEQEFSTSLSFGVTVAAYDLLTFNLAVAYCFVRQASAFVAIGSLQGIGMRPLPLFQIHITPRLSVDGYLWLRRYLSNGKLYSYVHGGLTWTL